MFGLHLLYVLWPNVVGHIEHWTFGTNHFVSHSAGSHQLQSTHWLFVCVFFLLHKSHIRFILMLTNDPKCLKFRGYKFLLFRFGIPSSTTLSVWTYYVSVIYSVRLRNDARLVFSYLWWVMLDVVSTPTFLFDTWWECKIYIFDGPLYDFWIRLFGCLSHRNSAQFAVKYVSLQWAEMVIGTFNETIHIISIAYR